MRNHINPDAIVRGMNYSTKEELLAILIRWQRDRVRMSENGTITEKMMEKLRRLNLIRTEDELRVMRHKDRIKFYNSIKKLQKSGITVSDGMSFVPDTISADAAAIVSKRENDTGRMATERMQSSYYDDLARFLKSPLIIEKPQGASLHHLMDYDRNYHGVSFIEQAHDHMAWDDLQNIVVEKEWGKLFSGNEDAEWRLPFEFCCFEFRISGARVLAFMIQDESSNVIHVPILAIGLARHWSCSQHEYQIRGVNVLEKSVRGTYDNERMYVGKEYKPLVDFIAKQVRAVSIVLDAQVTQCERVTPAPGLNQKRIKDGRSPIKEHRVVRLVKRERPHVRRGFAMQGERKPQGLHWRRGHYKHYPDYESGEIMYVNDGGFFLSKTWARWALAGDPDYGIIEKEYRV